MDILHANAYDTGSEGLGAGAGPICSTMAAKPYLTGEITYGFADVGSRNYMNIEDDEVLISIPNWQLKRIVTNLEEMLTKKFFQH